MANGPTSTETRHFRTLFALGAAGVLTDGQLLERFARRLGDPSELAFATLVERHGSMVLRVARAILRDDHSANDAFQATFLILARKARSLWVRDSLGPWLHAVALRVASDTRATNRRRQLRENQAARPEAFSPRDHHAAAEIARAIHEEIERLPQPYRLAVVTCVLEGWTQVEAADRLGWAVGTLQSRLARGRQRLRDRLQRRGFAPSILVTAAKGSPIPSALVASTARLASDLSQGGTIAGMIAPTVFAIIQTSTQGILMTKLKLGTLALLMVGGVIASGVGAGLGRPAVATQEPPLTPQKQPSQPPHLVVIPPEPSSPLVAEDPPAGPPIADDSLGFPILLYFHDNTSAFESMIREIDSLSQSGIALKSIDFDRSPELARRYKIKALPTFVLVDGKGQPIAELKGKLPATEVARFYEKHTAKPARAVVRKDDEPALLDPVIPRPWETAVRLRFAMRGLPGRTASGTVIDSTSDRTIVLTSAEDYPLDNVGINIDLFDGQFASPDQATLRPSTRTYPGTLLEVDFKLGLALIEIRPGYLLPVSPIADSRWKPETGMKLISLGCSQGGNASAWSTTIRKPAITVNQVGGIALNMIVCDHEPKPGRSGGGLFTTDGYLVGVCLFADRDDHTGLYSRPEYTRKMLDRIGQKRLVENLNEILTEPIESKPPPSVITPIAITITDEPTLTPAPEPVASGRRLLDQERRLVDLEKKLDRILKILEKPPAEPQAEPTKGSSPALKR